MGNNLDIIILNLNNTEDNRRRDNMARITYKKQSASRDQFKSLIPTDDVDTNSEYYGEDDNVSTQIVRNYKYEPRRY